MRLSSILAHARQHPVRSVRRCGLALTSALFVILAAITLGEIRSGLAEGSTPARESGHTATEPVATPDTRPVHPGPTAPATPAATTPDPATVAVWWDEAELNGDCVGVLGTGQRYVGGCPGTVETAFTNLRAGGRTGAAVFADTGVRACVDPYLRMSTLVGLDGSRHLLVEDVTGWWLVGERGLVLAFTGDESATPSWPITSRCLKR